MSNYDFHTLLEPLEFEGLVCDVVQQREGVFLQTYTEGRDSGIDGSYTDKNSNKTIVQVKRYKQDFNRLFRNLEQIELPKVRKLNPDRYILGVSIDFGPGQKEKIKKLFEGYISSNDDILSNKDINRLLNQPEYGWIVQAYPNLWVPTIAVFKNVLHETVHQALYVESAIELNRALQTSKSFFPTQVYREVLNKWPKNNVIIISGEPGVGKTAMAYLLALAYLQPKDLDGFVWANSINDIRKMLNDDKKQVFILDDFWGSIFHEEHRGRNEENQLNKLIREFIQSNGIKRLILTTREYVLQQGLQKHPGLKDTLKQYSITFTMEEYKDGEKASILFRHLYTSKLRYEYVIHIFKKYEEIIYHENYSPRVIASFLTTVPHKNCYPEDYFEQLCDHLDYPGSFWEGVFVELSTEAQIVAILLLISSTPMRLIDMQTCYVKYIHISNDSIKVRNFNQCIAELEKTMIKSFYDDNEDDILLKFNSPAIQDFLYSFIRENSEHYIPLILKCCAFYNQFEFLLEHFSKYCSNQVIYSIEQHCILHYRDYEYCYLEYDGSWNWETNTDFFNQNNELHRFFQLLSICDPNVHLSLFSFLETEINNYCGLMNNREASMSQYIDLLNLPDIIVKCIKKGMTFIDDKEIIAKYYTAAFSVFHYVAIEEFQQVFPEEFSNFHAQYFTKIKKELKNNILSELELLDELNMYLELDLLIDSIPDIFQKFGFQYTKQFNDKVIAICGRGPSEFDQKRNTPTNLIHDNVNREEQAHEAVQRDAAQWLFGPREMYLDEDQITEFALNSKLKTSLKTEISRILDTGTPHHIFNLLQTKESIELLFAAFASVDSIISKQESEISRIMLSHITEHDSELLINLIFFCAESFYLFMYQEEPILRLNEFLSSKIYDTYLRSNPALQDLVFEHFLIQDGQWVRFLHIPLFIFSHALLWIMISREEGSTELEEYYSELWGNNFFKLKRETRLGIKPEVSIYYVDYGDYHFKDIEWERCMYKMFEELIPHHFNQSYVEPMIKRYLDIIGTGDDDSKVLNHLSHCRIEYEFTDSGIPSGSGCCIDDEISLIEHLEIANVLEAYPERIKKSRLKELQKIEALCKNKERTWQLLIYETKDVNLLKEIGIYDDLLKFVNKVELVYKKFMNGDYSQIKMIKD